MLKKTSRLMKPPMILIMLMQAAILISPFVETASAQNHDEKPLELSGFSLSQAYEITDGDSLDLSDSKLNKLLYRIKKTTNQNLLEACRFSQDISWQQLLKETADYRLWVFQRRGRIHEIVPLRLPGASRDDLIRGVYLARCQSESGERFDVLTLTSPSAWKSDDALDQPIEFTGFFFALTKDESKAGSPEENVPLFVARRLAWYPEEAIPAQGVTDANVLLAARGVDIGQFDFVRQQYGKPLGKEDSDIFFQVLSAIESVTPTEVTQPTLGFNELMKAPLENIGKFVSFRARVRKCSPVQITNPDLQARMGFDRFYQLMVFPDLDDQQIVVKNPDGEDLVYRRFPVTMCVRSLPAGMKPSDIENQQVVVEGCYFRFWKYASDLTDQAGVSGQISPLIISNCPLLVVSDGETLNLILCGFLLAIILGLVTLYWIFRNPKKRPALRSMPSDLPDQMDVTGID